jgi:2-polyprenyl-3-methyl-5-hydroxy-6-metoxy-1,4-benzoquinol methylase
MDEIIHEKERQDLMPWNRSTYHSDYNHYLAYYKVKSCLENARGTSLLDIACGDGMMTESFAKHFKRVVGVDASGKHLDMARKRVSQAEFYECLIEDFNLKEHFDSVFMLDLLEHVIDPIAVLKKAAGFLSNDGVLIIHVPNAYAINRRLAVLMETLESCTELSPFDVQIAGHRRSYSMESLKKDIDQAGLHILQTGGIFYKMLSTPQMDWFLKNGLWESGHGWGRTGMETSKDWKAEFCRACYEFGKDKPEDCNIIYACVTR